MKDSVGRLALLLAIGACLSKTALAQDGRATNHIFPQVADGRFGDGTYYRSALQISNPSSTASGTCALVFRGLVTQVEGPTGITSSVGSLSIPITANGWSVHRTLGTAPFQSGYAALTCSIPVNAILIYGFYAADKTKLSEASVFSSPAGTALQVISDQRDGAKLGIAITNDTDTAMTATITAGNLQGQPIGTVAVPIAARSQFVKFVYEAVNGLPADHFGQVMVASPGNPIEMIGLRFTGSAFTTIPSSIRDAVKSTQQVQTERMLGTWAFAYTIISTFSDTFHLTSVSQTSTSGDWYVSGTNQYNNIVVASYSSTLSKFSLLAAGLTADDYFSFDLTPAGTATSGGCYYFLPHGYTSLGSCYTMTGVRISASLMETPQPGLLTLSREESMKSQEAAPLFSGDRAEGDRVVFEQLQKLKMQLQ